MMNMLNMPDEIARLRAGHTPAFEQIIRTHNQRLFRLARAILRDAFEAEDVVQEAYIKVFSDLDSFAEVTDPGAWLARVTTNLALSRLRQKKRNARLIDSLKIELPTGASLMTAETQTAQTQIRHLLEREIDALPDGFREVFVLRLVEDLSVSETAEVLGISPQTVKSRLNRARAKIQHAIKAQLTVASLQVFPFAGVHCDRITANTLQQLKAAGIT
ncbi:MAG: RNA polymerase sigma factor [Rhodobacteraceae bacterium]|nr:RNA polymerase sigma factor [Paracoccaceae bacterium]